MSKILQINICTSNKNINVSTNKIQQNVPPPSQEYSLEHDFVLDVAETVWVGKLAQDFVLDVAETVWVGKLARVKLIAVCLF
jgi:hypothetical protein